MACENVHCIANYKGECAVEKCQGEIRTTRNIKKDKENRKLIYEIARKSFDDYFKEEAYGKENRA